MMHGQKNIKSNSNCLPVKLCVLHTMQVDCNRTA